MDRIDKPLDVAIKQLDENPESTPLEITLKLATVIPAVAIADSIREHFSNRRRFERLKDVIVVFNAELEALRAEFTGDKQRLDALCDRLKSPEFAEAIRAAVEEAVRSTNAEKIKQLGRVLANGSDASIAPSNADDLSSFIRDVSQLSQGDIQVLEQLDTILGFDFAQGSQRSSLPESPLQSIIDDAQRQKLLTEDFYSHCFRLVGFGLAAQIRSNSPIDAVDGNAFRLTRRGRRLLSLLRQRT